ncbi:MAG: serine/threonine-protein kinase, partial [Planctomycetota bacterium]
GGMGVVYEAEQEGLRRRVALKVLPVSRSQRAAERFRLEASAAARMHHSNIVPVFEVGGDDEQLYYSMQLIEGRSLDELINEGARAGGTNDAGSLLAWRSTSGGRTGGGSSSNGSTRDTGSRSSRISTAYRRVAELGHQVAQALAYSHERGIIHRDIKPSNLLLDDSGVVWVTDFGLAKAPDTELTRSGEVVGTIRYMSPERFRGKCDERADVYSLGVTLYELATFEPAFRAPDRVQLMEMIAQRDPVSPSLRDPLMPRDLETIILRAIEKEPQRRYASASALADDLRRFLNDEPIHARRTSSLERAWRWARRNPSVAVSASIVAALLVMTAVASLLVAAEWRKKTEQFSEETRRAQKAERLADQAKNREAQLRVAAEDERLAMRRRLYRSDVMRAAVVNQRSDVRGLLDAWVPERQASGDEDLRSWEWYALRTRSKGPKARLEVPGIRFVRYSRDGSRFAAAVGEGVYVWESIDRPPLKLNEPVSRVGRLAWSWDSRWLAAASREKVYVWEIASPGKPRESSLEFVVSALAWSPSGELSIAGEGSSILLWDPKRPTPEKKLLLQQRSIRSLEWSYDGRYLASGGQGNCQIFDRNVGRAQKLRRLARVRELRFRPNSHDLAIVGTAGIVVDVVTGRPRVSLGSGAGTIECASWSPDGENLAVSARSVSLFVTNIASSRFVFALPPHTVPVASIEWSPGGDHILVVERELAINVWPATPVHDYVLVDANNSKKVSWNGEDFVQSLGESQVVTWQRGKCMPVARRKLGPTKKVDVIDWNPSDPRMFAWADRHGGAWMLDERSEELVSLPSQRRVTELAWSHEGNRIALRGDGWLTMYSAESRNVERTIEGLAGSGVLAWNPAGSLIAVAEAGGALRFWSAVDGQASAEAQDVFGEINGIEWSPTEEDEVLTASADGGVRVWSSVTGELLQLVVTHPLGATAATWTRDGRRIISSGNDHLLLVSDPLNGEEYMRVLMKPAARGFQWSPSGRRLAASLGSSGVSVFDAAPAFELDLARTSR